MLEEARENHYERCSYTCQVCHQQQENFPVNGKPYAPRPGNSDYGFRYLGTQENGLEMQNMYLRIYEACEAFMGSQQDVTAETKYQLLISAMICRTRNFGISLDPHTSFFVTIIPGTTGLHWGTRNPPAEWTVTLSTSVKNTILHPHAGNVVPPLKK